MDNYIKQQIDSIDKRIGENRKLLSDPEFSVLAQAEIAELEGQKQALQKAGDYGGQTETTQGVEDNINPNIATLEVRAAAGGDEAGLFAAELLRMYSRFAHSQGWQVEELDRSEGGLRQIKQATLKIQGKDAYTSLKSESGVHRVQRVPETESSGRIHTSTVTVAVLPEVPEKKISLNPNDLEFEAFRASGAGGQNVNKVSTAVRLKHLPSGLIVTAQTERSQLQNRENALSLLRAKLWEEEHRRRESQISGQRASQVGTGERSEKIRTYNFPQNRVTDHRLGKSWHNLERILSGDLLPIIEALRQLAND